MTSLSHFIEKEELRIALLTTRAQNGIATERSETTLPRETSSGATSIEADLADDCLVEDLPSSSGSPLPLREDAKPHEMKNGSSSSHEGEEEDDEHHVLTRLPDEVFLDCVVAKFLDEDTIFLIFPLVCKRWHEEFAFRRGERVPHQHLARRRALDAHLWKRLCHRAFQPLLRNGLKILTTEAEKSDPARWKHKFLRRPRLRTGGAYYFLQVFVSYPGPRNIWTPRDAPRGVQMVYHYRFWWFLPDGKTFLYASLPTRQPQKIVEKMRLAVLGGKIEPEDAERVWWGEYSIEKAHASHSEAPPVFKAVCLIRMTQHAVRFALELRPGGSKAVLTLHQSYAYHDPDDVLNHPLPTNARSDRDTGGTSGDEEERMREMWYIPAYC